MLDARKQGNANSIQVCVGAVLLMGSYATTPDFAADLARVRLKNLASATFCRSDSTTLPMASPPRRGDSMAWWSPGAPLLVLGAWLAAGSVVPTATPAPLLADALASSRSFSRMGFGAEPAGAAETAAE